MKKFFTILLIIILLGAGVFFTGWTQVFVTHGSYGVLRSKSHGVYNQVIADGKFIWLWYKLIPANVKITSFNIKNQNIFVRASGVLPNAETYISFVGLKASFAWQVSGNVSFIINPDSLPRMTEQFNITSQQELDTYTRDLYSRISPFIEQRLAYYCEQRDVLEQINAAGSYKPLDGDIAAAFPYITRLECSLSVKQFPDYDLYESASAMYDDYIAHQREILNSQITANAAGRINSQFRLDELSKYGELLTKYPVLLDYLKIQAGSIGEN
ncbi:MAG: hypothetical protein LBB22_03310 [Treponema sp.]|jgi:hypothetical protein|nr:hypothetical protein [Treponema sp.]